MERNTRQRAAILGAIEAAGRPLSPTELHGMARSEAPALGLATVYRTIKSLLQEHRIREVSLPGEPARYEVAHLGHHHHFKCTLCDRVFDIAECTTDWNALAPAGFIVEAHDVTLFGRCSDCVHDSSPPSPTHSRHREH